MNQTLQSMSAWLLYTLLLGWILRLIWIDLSILWVLPCHIVEVSFVSILGSTSWSIHWSAQIASWPIVVQLAVASVLLHGHRLRCAWELASSWFLFASKRLCIRELTHFRCVSVTGLALQLGWRIWWITAMTWSCLTCLICRTALTSDLTRWLLASHGVSCWDWCLELHHDLVQVCIILAHLLDREAVVYLVLSRRSRLCRSILWWYSRCTRCFHDVVE